LQNNGGVATISDAETVIVIRDNLKSRHNKSGGVARDLN
jgi:hypothetical protein